MSVEQPVADVDEARRPRRGSRSPRGARARPRRPGAPRSRGRRRAASTGRRPRPTGRCGRAGRGPRRRGTARTPRRAPGRRSRSRGPRRGSADRGPGGRGRDHPSRGPSSHAGRVARRAVGRRTRARSDARGTPGAAIDTASLVANRRCIARSYASAARAGSDRPRTTASMAGAASSAETRARWSPSPLNGSRNPAASPTRNQPWAGSGVARMPSGAAPATASVGWSSAARHGAGSSAVAGRSRRIPAAEGGRPLALRSAGRHDGPRTMPDVDPLAGHRRDADVSVADDLRDGPRPASSPRPSARW